MPAQAAAVLDQDSFFAPPSGPPTNGYIVTVARTLNDTRAAQTVTTGVSGRLESIEFQRVFVPNNATYLFSLYDGAFQMGNLVGTVALPAAFGTLSLDLSGFNHQVVQGGLFSFTLSAVGQPGLSQGASFGVGTFAGANFPNPPPILNFNDYAGGQHFISVNGSPYGLARGDIGFRTYVDTAISAVPEPSTWTMMILGFGLIGGAMRQTKKARVAFD